MGSLYDVNVEGIGKVSGGRYKNVNVEGSITEEDEKGKKKSDPDLEW